MKCVLNGRNAAVLAKVIHSFARIGCELYLEADSAAGLSLRTVNMTKSAFASIVFGLDFFTSFVAKSKVSDENHCKLSMKALVGVFRNMKQVESCTISMNVKDFKLIVQLKCRLETLRTHHISILEQESLQATYFTDRSLNVLGGNHKLFSNIVTNFKTNEEELSIKASEKDVVVQNYADGTHVDNRFVRTQITLKPEEFENFKVAESTTITFCMRELRAILNFAELMNTNISAHFDTAGKPVVFVIKDFETFEVNLVMSTLSPEDTEYEVQRSRSIVQFSSQASNHISLDKTHANDNGDSDNGHQPVDTSGTVGSKKRNLTCSNGSDFGNNLAPLDVVCNKKRRTSQENRRDTHLPSMSRENVTEQPSPQIDLQSENIEVVFQEDSPELDSFAQDNSLNAMDVDVNSDQNQLNRRDHRPKVRQIFARCFADSGQSSMSLGRVLAECSDDEQ